LTKDYFRRAYRENELRLPKEFMKMCFDNVLDEINKKLETVFENCSKID
jgi:hypothetical protein